MYLYLLFDFMNYFESNRNHRTPCIRAIDRATAGIPFFFLYATAESFRVTIFAR